MTAEIVPAADVASLSSERLEREIGELAAHINAACCRWLCLVAEYDRREDWAGWGAKSCAAWLSWRCGLTPGAAREHVRVARRLAELPLARESFASGELSYSKVRAITRVASGENEADLVELARHATGAQLERLVRSYHGVLALEDANRVHEERYLDWTWEDDGSLILRGRLPAEDGAMLLAALEAARDRLRADAGVSAETGGDAVPDPDAPSGADVSAETCHDAVPDPDAPSGADVSAETGGDSVPDLDAPSGAGVSAETGGGDVSAETCGDRGLAAVGGAGISAETPTAAETPDEDAHPPADEPARGATNADALVLLAETFAATGAAQRAGGERCQVIVHVDQAALSDAEDAARCELDHGPALPAETVRRLACDAALVTMLERDGRPLTVGRKTRTIPPALRRALHSRDGGCQFPGCTQRRFVDAHHIHHWAQGGETKLTNLVLLCRRHHRLLHEGGYSAQRQPGQGITFRRPDGRPIRHAPTPRRGDRHELVQHHQRHGPAVDAATCTPRSLGDRLDYDMAVEGLCARDRPSHADGS